MFNKSHQRLIEGSQGTEALLNCFIYLVKVKIQKLRENRKNAKTFLISKYLYFDLYLTSKTKLCLIRNKDCE